VDDYSPSYNPLSFTPSSETRSVCAVLPVRRSSSVPHGSLCSGFPSELPLLWFSKERPSADIRCSRPVPTSPRGCLRPGVAKHPDTFRPCRSSRLRRLSPRAALQVYCTLQPAMGFEPFPPRSPSVCVSTFVGPPCLSLARSSHPSKLFPPWKPHRVTAAVAISPSLRTLFPVCVPRPHGLAPPGIPLPTHTVSCVSQPDAPLGFVPLQGAPLDTAAHWTAPERRRRSGHTLGHAHLSGRALNVADA